MTNYNLVHVFGLWLEMWVFHEKLLRHTENMQTPLRKAPASGFKPWTFLLLGKCANNYTATGIVYITEHMFTINKLPINLFISSKLTVCEQLQNLTMLYFNWELSAQ